MTTIPKVEYLHAAFLGAENGPCKFGSPIRYAFTSCGGRPEVRDGMFTWKDRMSGWLDGVPIVTSEEFERIYGGKA